MALISQTLTILLLVNALHALTETEGTPEKIVIHIPYKIQHHHHTHTNYKVITVPKGTEPDKMEEPTTMRELEMTTEPAVVETGTPLSAAYNAPKIRTFVRVKETIPLYEYFGLNKLFGGEDKPRKPPSKLEIVHEEPTVEHLLHGPWQGTEQSTDKFQYQGGEKEVNNKYQAPLESYDASYYPSHHYASSGGGEAAAMAHYDDRMLGGDDNYAKYSVHKPVYQVRPTSAGQYHVHEGQGQTKAMADAIQQVFKKHLYKDFPEIKKGKVVKHVAPSTASKKSIMVNAQGKSLSLTPISMNKETSNNYEHIGFLVVGDDNTHQFIGVDEKHATGG